MIPPELLAIVRCPATGQTLMPCPAEILATVNRQITATPGNGLTNLGGQAVSCALVDALLRADGKILYPIQDGIPVLLAEEGIAVPSS